MKCYRDKEDSLILKRIFAGLRLADELYSPSLSLKFHGKLTLENNKIIIRINNTVNNT
jgi:hypothetical protein